MKKYIEFIVICLLIGLSVPFANYVGDQADIVRLNNSIMIDDLALLTPIEESKEVKNRDYIALHGYGGRSFEKRDRSILVIYSGYPDVMDDYHLTSIIVKSGDYEVYDLTIGSAIEETKKLSNLHGYRQEIIGSRWIYIKNKVTISFQKNHKSKISAFRIIVETTNKNDVAF